MTHCASTAGEYHLVRIEDISAAHLHRREAAVAFYAFLTK